MNSSAEYIICPCCATAYSRIDAPIEWSRVNSWDALKYAAKTLASHSKGHRKTLTPEQRQAKAKVMAVNRSKRRQSSN